MLEECWRWELSLLRPWQACRLDSDTPVQSLMALEAGRPATGPTTLHFQLPLHLHLVQYGNSVFGALKVERRQGNESRAIKKISCIKRRESFS